MAPEPSHRTRSLTAALATHQFRRRSLAAVRARRRHRPSPQRLLAGAGDRCGNRSAGGRRGGAADGASLRARPFFARGEPRAKLLPAALAAAALLAPAEQAALHTTVSLQKHVVFGAWFAAIAAGYAMARLSRVDPGRGWAPVMALPIAAATIFGSTGQAAALYQVWPNAAAAVSVLRSEVQLHPGRYLAEDYDVEAYYLDADVPWPRWSSTYYLEYQGAAQGAASYRAAIASHYFSLVILDFADTTVTDQQVTADMSRAGDYYVAARAGRW